MDFEKERTGSLFQQHTKAICISKPPKLMPAWYSQAGVTVFNPTNAAKEYPFACMSYIHYNPVNDGIVKNSSDWRYSSYSEYKGIAKIELVNLKKGRYYFID